MKEVLLKSSLLPHFLLWVWTYEPWVSERWRETHQRRKEGTGPLQAQSRPGGGEGGEAFPVKGQKELQEVSYLFCMQPGLIPQYLIWFSEHCQEWSMNTNPEVSPEHHLVCLPNKKKRARKNMTKTKIRMMHECIPCYNQLGKSLIFHNYRTSYRMWGSLPDIFPRDSGKKYFHLEVYRSKPLNYFYYYHY